MAVLAGAALGSATVACSDDPGGGIGLAFSTRPAPGGAVGGALRASVMQLGDTVVLNGDSIILETVEVVLQEIEIEGEDVADCQPSSGDDDDGCEEFSYGAQLVSLPLGSETEKVVTLTGVPPGMYDEVEFDLHPPVSPGDDAFIAANPLFNGVSIRVTGFYRPAGAAERTAFTYTTDLSQQEEIELSPPLDVTADGMANITIRIDVSTWFLTADGNEVVDPATAGPGGANESLVESNIQQSINAFQDDDSDGLDDDSEDDDGGDDPDDDDS
jgi:hypothetical protein